jgi:large subunit ribosomal protein L20
MTRVKKGVNALKTRRNVLKQVKGYRFGRSKKERQAYEAISHAGSYAFAHRRDKKGEFRRLWNVKLNASLRPLGITYSKFIGALRTLRRFFNAFTAPFTLVMLVDYRIKYLLRNDSWICCP